MKTIEDKLKTVQLNKRHGLIGAIHKRTGISRLTISEFLKGNIYRLHTQEVIDIAIEEINKYENKD